MSKTVGKVIFSKPNLINSRTDSFSTSSRPQDEENRIKSAIDATDAKLQRGEQKRVIMLQRKLENTKKWNELNDNRMAKKMLDETINKEMCFRDLEAKQ